MKQNPVNRSTKTGKKTTPLPDLTHITQEKIINSNQLLTVIPLLTNDAQENSRILLLKVKNELKSVVFSMYPEEDTVSKYFSGKIMTRNLDGDFVNGFRVKDGNIISQFVKRNAVAKNNISNRMEEPEVLHEVIIINSYHNIASFDLTLFFWDLDSINNGYNNGYLSWDTGGGRDYGYESESDPCSTAEANTTISKDSKYLSAKTRIVTASSDGLEHSITLGKDANGQITQAPMNTGGPYNVSTNTSWPGAFAALHNHPNNTPLSAGDIYASVKLNVKSRNFTTSFVLTDGEVYGIVVTDLAAAQAFVATYPADQLPNQSPEFPNQIFYEIEDFRPTMGYNNDGLTRAIAFVLDKYNAGITLLKQDSSGEFNPIKTKETTQPNGSKTYTSIPCN